MLGVVSSNLITRSIYFFVEVNEASRINDLGSCETRLIRAPVHVRVRTAVEIQAGSEHFCYLPANFFKRCLEVHRHRIARPAP